MRIELVIIAGYLVIMLLIGIFTNSMAKKSLSGFWSADSSISWQVNGLCILATVMSGGGMMGSIGIGSTLGVVYILMGTWSTCIGVGISAVVIAPPLRKTKARTLPDYFFIRYDSKLLSGLVALVICVTYSIYLSTQLKAGGTVGQYIMDYPYLRGAFITWIVFTLYTMLGGMFAVTWNDFIQGILMMFCVCSVAIIALLKQGGWMGIYESATAAYPNMGVWHLPYISYLGFFSIWILAQLLAPAVVMRVATAKNPFQAGMSMHWAMLLLSVFTMATLLIMSPACRAIAGAEPLANNDAYLLLWLNEMVGPTFRGIIGAGIFAAIMSTGAGVLLACGSALSNDIICKMWKLSPKGERRSALLSCAVLAVIAMLLAINPPPLLGILYSQAFNFMMVSLIIPFILGMWWKRGTTPAAIATVIAGALGYGIAHFVVKVPELSETFFVLPVAIVVYVAVSLMTKAPSDEKVAQIESWHVREEGVLI